ncbi:hypothetical protein TcCL_Unassigned05846 [Trypanosoma cruzi]|nr:hypothetical protein TcCL_Unassigned05846 [Trypanosoma cruzi]
MARTGGSAAVVGMFACFCQAALEQIPHLRILVSFVEREGNHWLDLIYQMSGPTSLPLRLRRYAVQEVSLLSHAFFHCVSSVRDMIDLTFKAMQNCPQRSNTVQKEDSLVIQLIGVPRDVEIQGGEGNAGGIVGGKSDRVDSTCRLWCVVGRMGDSFFRFSTVYVL